MQRAPRKLTVLASLDVAGYSRLVEREERRTLSDLARNVFTFLVMLLVSFLVGFRLEGGIGPAIVATALMLAFSYSFSWIQAWIGLSVSSVEAANSAGFIWMFPLTFVSSAFVPTDTMPAAMRWFAERNPFTIVTNAARALYSGNPVGSDAWVSFAWAAGITVVFATISIRAFTRSAAR